MRGRYEEIVNLWPNVEHFPREKWREEGGRRPSRNCYVAEVRENILTIIKLH